jgi:hypothetical protein
VPPERPKICSAPVEYVVGLSTLLLTSNQVARLAVQLSEEMPWSAFFIRLLTCSEQQRAALLAALHYTTCERHRHAPGLPKKRHSDCHNLPYGNNKKRSRNQADHAACKPHLSRHFLWFAMSPTAVASFYSHLCLILVCDP